MMIHDYINSKDIREYLIKIQYDFSILEQVYIIRHSKYKSLKEKQRAYRELILSTDDTILGSDGKRRWKNTSYDGMSVHKIIEEYISDLNAHEDSFYKVSEDEYCTITYYYDSSEDNCCCETCRQEDGNVFKSVHEAYEYALEVIKESGTDSSKIMRFVIYKNHFKHLDSQNNESIIGVYDSKGNLIQLDPDSTECTEEFFDKL